MSATAMTPEATARRHLWTADAYLRAWEAGVFPPDLRTELIDGEIIEMSAQGADHIYAVMNTNECLRDVFGEQNHVRVQMTLRLGRNAVPEPDLLVVRGSHRDAPAAPAVEDILLVVEVAHHTLAYDRNDKAAVYARAGIREYWIVNLRERQIEIHRQPEAAADGFRYAERRVVPEGEQVQPLAAPQSEPLPVADLLPATA